MHEQDALLQAVCNNPDDNTARMRHAEWLERQGDPLGSFIKLQLAESGVPVGRLIRVVNINDLRRQHQDQWEKPWRDLGVIGMEFSRGYPEHIVIPADRFLQHRDRLFALGPIREVTLVRGGRPASYARELAQCSQLDKLRRLDVRANLIGDEGAFALARSPFIGKLEELDVSSNRITARGIKELVGSPHLGRLRTLRVSSNPIGDDGARAVTDSPYLANLENLNLAETGLTDVGLQAIASSARMANLRRFDANDNDITDAGARALAASQHLQELEHLGLDGAPITTEGVSALRQSSNLPNLKELEVSAPITPPIVARARERKSNEQPRRR